MQEFMTAVGLDDGSGTEATFGGREEGGVRLLL